MKSIWKFVMISTLSLAAGIALGIMVYSSHVESERHKALASAQFHLSEGRYEEAIIMALQQIDEGFAPFSILDIVGWGYFCRGEQSVAIALWEVQAHFYRSIEAPAASMYEEKLAFLRSDPSLDDEKQAFFVNMLVCPPG